MMDPDESTVNSSAKLRVSFRLGRGTLGQAGFYQQI